MKRQRQATRRVGFLGLLFGLAAPFLPSAGGYAQERSSPYDVEPGERLTLLVENMRLEQENLETLESDFVQRKESELLLEPELATGVFSYAAPDRVRWEYDDPTPISLLIDGDHMVTWYRDLSQVEEIEIGRHSQRVLDYLGAGSSLARLIEYFDVRLTLPADRLLPFHLSMEPKFERVARRLQGMDIWVDPKTYLPVRLRYVEADGDVTDYEFSNFRVNEPIAEGRFELQLPNDVQVRTIDLNRRAGLQ
ncbi:MAG: outer membrane lipoprotein carrier protein LolA [Acidobacteria bacterium]|nr:outer membrane lipoprotein carrier protein LolA [Acidobacteriota bacterium]